MKELYKVAQSSWTRKRYADTQFVVTEQTTIRINVNDLLIYIGPWRHNIGKKRFKTNARFYLHLKTGSYIVLQDYQTIKLV